MTAYKLPSSDDIKKVIDDSFPHELCWHDVYLELRKQGFECSKQRVRNMMISMWKYEILDRRAVGHTYLYSVKRWRF